MLAWRRYQARFCKGCGHPVEKARHPDNDGWYRGRVASECHGCTALAVAQWEAGGSKGDQPEPVQYFEVVDERDYAAKPLPPFPNQASAQPREP